jgi:hypothetical protein
MRNMHVVIGGLSPIAKFQSPGYYGSSDKSADLLSAEIKEMVKRELNYESKLAVGEVASLSIDGRTGYSSLPITTIWNE